MVSEFLTASVQEAWEAYECAPSSSRVAPAMPILFFGNVDGYLSSQIRVVTVGLNPSWHEFPKNFRFQRFPRCAGISRADSAHYMEGLSAYFEEYPYRRWFRAYEAALDGADASYWRGRSSTALHTDIGSPVATHPAWTNLDESDRQALQRKGGPIWHRLITELKPHLVLASLAWEHLSRVEFPPVTDWWQIQVFDTKIDGSRREPPYPVMARWYEIAGAPSLFVFGKQRDIPFGEIGNEQKRDVGERARRAYEQGPESLT